VVAPQLTPIPYACPACGWNGEVGKQVLEGLREVAASMATVGPFACAFDERMVCEGCRPKPARDETDLRDRWIEFDRGYRIEVVHVARDVRRVVWVNHTDLADLEVTLRGERDARYLGDSRLGGGRRVEPGLRKWWRAFRAAIDGDTAG
jgi:hypothetical protein